MDGLRQEGDSLADTLVPFLISNAEIAEGFNSWNQVPSQEDIDEFPAPLRNFLLLFTEKPDWMDVRKVKMAQAFFSENGSIYLSLLGFYSLPYCYAFADGAQVLVRSKRITDEVGMRLSETALFLLDSFKPGLFISHSDGLMSIAKVRLIHAYSRFFILKHAKDWKESWGLPVNQEDLLGTNLAFSLMVIRGLEKMDKFPGKEVLEAVLHYWKVIGYYLGIQVAYWPETAKEAFELEKLVRKRHLKSSEAGQKLIQSLLNFYRSNVPNEGLAKLSESMVSFFVGEEASAALGLKQEHILPKTLYPLVLRLNGWQQGGFNPSYQKIRLDFLAQTKAQFGREVSLQIPMIKRS